MFSCAKCDDDDDDDKYDDVDAELCKWRHCLRGRRRQANGRARNAVRSERGVPPDERRGKSECHRQSRSDSAELRRCRSPLDQVSFVVSRDRRAVCVCLTTHQNPIAVESLDGDRLGAAATFDKELCRSHHRRRRTDARQNRCAPRRARVTRKTHVVVWRQRAEATLHAQRHKSATLRLVSASCSVCTGVHCIAGVL